MEECKDSPELKIQNELKDSPSSQEEKDTDQKMS